MAVTRYANREEAGFILAQKLLPFKGSNPLVLALPRGGVPVAFEVAKILNAELDILGVKKIGLPGNTEFAIGAVSENSRGWLNQALVQRLGVRDEEVQELIEVKRQELKHQLQQLRGDQERRSVKGRVVLIVDDGVATGASMIAAIHCLRQEEVREVIVATAVAPESTLKVLRKLADEVISLKIPEPFYAVGDWYEDFSQVSDFEVQKILAQANKEWTPEKPLPRI